MNIGIAKDENGMLRKIVFERDFGWRPGGIREIDRDERYRFQLRNRLFDRQQDTRAVGTPFIAHDQRCNGNARRAGQHDPDFKMVDPASNETDPCRIYGKQLLSVLNVDGVKLKQLKELGLRERTLQNDFNIHQNAGASQAVGQIDGQRCRRGDDPSHRDDCDVLRRHLFQPA
jgi:hypothetical protein